MDEQEVRKYYDVNDNELSESDIDYDLGRVEYETRVIKHHEAEDEQPEENHYEVATFYFEDGTSLSIESQDDPHIEKIEPDKGIFGYIDQGEGKELRGIDLKTVVDKESVPAKEAWDETEDFYRYILYTPEELEENRLCKEAREKQQEFLKNGPVRLDVTEKDIANLGVDVGDLSVTLVEIMENL